MSRARWHFKKRGRADEAANPVQGEFFDESLDPEERRRGPAASLVREAIQNSWDARIPGERVHVRIALSDESALSKTRAKHWFGDLWPHLEAKGSGLRNLPPWTGRYLVIEDFGTHGLEGDVARENIPDEGTREDFFAFFRSNGLSGKHGQSGGRWGVGKSVFNRASRINSFLAFTIRNSDRNAFLLGRCFLMIHKIDGNEFVPYGRFGTALEDGFVLPVDDPDLINQFVHDFRLVRQPDTDATGLSIVVPYADEGISAKDLLSAVAREYFYPILEEKLSVQVSGPDLPHPVNLTDKDILECLDSITEPGLLGAAQLALWGRKHARTEQIVLAPCPQGSPPEWSDELLPDGDALASVAERYERGQPVNFRISLHVQETGKRAKPTHFDVYLQRDREGQGYRPVFIRNGLIITKALERRVRNHSLYAVVLIEDEPLATLLGDAETPAHTNWSADTTNFKGKYDFGPRTIDFVKNAPRQLAEFLANARTERDFLTLADFFPRPVDDGIPDDDDEPGPDPGPRPPKPKPPVEQQAEPYRIESIESGFVVLRDHPDKTPLPERLEILVAYDTSRGNPIKKYHPADFDVSRRPIRLECGGVDLIEAAANRILIAPRHDDFRLRVSGFDANRDVYVKVTVPASDSLDTDADDVIDFAEVAS